VAVLEFMVKEVVAMGASKQWQFMNIFLQNPAVPHIFLTVFRKPKQVVAAVHLVVMGIQVQVLHCLPLLLVQ
jgi:hypothetical protein